jgi:glycosyltransferase involved in cell wall biosynthesis
MTGKKLLEMNFNKEVSDTAIIFVNFDIGFNLGNIPEYLISRYRKVFLYSIYFRGVQHNGKSYIEFYNDGKLKYKKYNFTSKSNNPVRIILSYIIYGINILKIKNKNKNNILISPNPFFIFFGIIFRTKTLYLVGDIMRSNNANLFTKIFSSITKIIINISIKNSDFVWFISSSLYNYFKNIKTKNAPILQTMAIKPFNINNRNSKIKVLYIGSFDKSKGVDLILKVAKKISYIDFVLIGNSQLKDVKVDGNITIYPPQINQDLIEIINKSYFIGVAPYQKPIGHEKYLGDPTKIKQYLSYGMPTITTNFVEFLDVLEKYKAGKSISYSEIDLENAIIEIYNNYNEYKKNVDILIKDYSIDELYNKIFSEIVKN